MSSTIKQAPVKRRVVKITTSTNKSNAKESKSVPIPKKMITLKLAPASLERANALLADPSTTHERGGTVVIDANGQMYLQETKTNRRGTDFIDLPLGTVMWHTHPQTCTSKESCGLGMPSSSDVERFIIDAIEHPCYAHMVFAHEGTYVMALKPSARKRISAMPVNERNAYAKQVSERFTDLQNQFEKNFEKTTYKTFQQYWMHRANAQVLDVVFFPKGRLPQFSVRTTAT